MPTDNPGAAADAASPEPTEAPGAAAVADATDDHAPQTGKSAPAPADPDIPPSIEALLTSDDPEERRQGAKLFESSYGQDAPEAVAEDAAGTDDDAHVEEAAGETAAGEETETDATVQAAAAEEESKLILPDREKLKGTLNEDEHLAMYRALQLKRKHPDRDFRDILKEVGLTKPAETAKAADAAGTVAAEAEAAPAPEASAEELSGQVAALEDEMDDDPFNVELRKTNRTKLRELSQKLATAQAFESSLANEAAAKAETIRGFAPEFTDPNAPLFKTAAKLDAEMRRDNPGFFRKPGWMEKFAKLVFIEAGRDELIPLLNGKKPAAAPAKVTNGNKPAPAPAAEKPRVAKKNGTPVAMLATGRGGDDGRGLFAKVQSGQGSYDDAVAVARALEGK